MSNLPPQSPGPEDTGIIIRDIPSYHAVHAVELSEASADVQNNQHLPDTKSTPLRPIKGSAAEVESAKPHAHGNNRRDAKRIRLKDTGCTQGGQQASSDRVLRSRKRALDKDQDKDAAGSKRSSSKVSKNHRANKRARVQTSKQKEKQTAVENSKGSGGREGDEPDRNADIGGNAGKELLLPVELHALILEQLWDNTKVYCRDVRALCASALTCSRWRQAARPHIFRSLTLKDHARLDDLADIMSANPKVREWIRKVRLVGSWPYFDDRHSGITFEQVKQQQRGRDLWIFQFPSIALPNIKVLELSDFAYLSTCPDDCHAFGQWLHRLASLESIEVLNMFHCAMEQDSMSALIRAFPRLIDLTQGQRSMFFSQDTTILGYADPMSFLGEELIEIVVPPIPSVLLGTVTIDHPVTEDIVAFFGLAGDTGFPLYDTAYSVLPAHHSASSAPVYTAIHPPAQLQHLRLDNNDGPEALDFRLLISSGSVLLADLSRTLKSLCIGVCVEFLSAAAFVAGLGDAPALERLELLIGQEPPFFIKNSLDISNLSKLKTLVLRFVGLNDDIINALHRKLSQLNAQHLQELVFRCDFQGDVGSVGKIRDYLATKEFEKLKVFRVEIVNHQVPFAELRKGVEKLFPIMVERDILQVIEYE
ncbi:unnamed protein product [Somion occarium]|uniref:F-box domain-containing protein n=1 Tax=Somion occarium TaxID=3059160 RepID=A0ABP1DL72_9APHY